MCKKLIALLPPHDSYKIYCEPFGGAASVLLNKPRSTIEAYNDYDGNLVNLFMVVRDEPQEFLRRFNLLLYSRELTKRWTGEIFKEKWPEDPVERAVHYYYVMRSSFAAYPRHGWAFGRARQPVNSLYNSLKNIELIGARLKGVYIDRIDFRDCIRNWDSPETVFYCDPPYWGTEHYYTTCPTVFKEQEHLDLHDLLTTKVQGKWLLTEGDHPKVRKLYKGCYIIKKRTMLAAKPQTRTQKFNRKKALGNLLIANYDIRRVWRKIQRKQRKK